MSLGPVARRVKLQEELIPIATLLGGALIGATSAFFVCKSKEQRKIREISRQHDQSVNELNHKHSESKHKLEEEQRQLSVQLQNQVVELNDTVEALRGHVELRESELELVNRCQQEFFQAKSSADCWQILLRYSSTLFENDQTFAAIFEPHAPFDPLASTNHLTAQDKLTTALLQVLPKATELENNRVQLCNASDAPAVCEMFPHVKRLVLAPVGISSESEEQRYGYLVAAVGHEPPQHKLRWLRKVLEIFCHVLHRVREYEEEVRSSRVDPLTGLPNGRVLSELLTPMLEKSTEEYQTACLFIECDNLKAINEKYGTLVGDELVKELAALIAHSERVEELNNDNKRRHADLLVRYIGTQFVLVLEDTDLQFALMVAERVRAAVEAKKDWYGSVPAWSVSIGVSIAPADDTDYRMLLLKAEVALMYVKEKLHGNQAIAFMQVPRQYRTSKLSARVGGSLGVFDPFSVLQSMAMANKTGILTVEEDTGKKFWAFFEGSKITKAHLGNLRGDYAIIEFLSTFENGNFAFREYSSLDKETMEEIHRMGDPYSVKKPTDKHLLDGALAQDKLANARRIITNTRLYLRPSKDFSTIVAGFPKLPDAPTPDELEVIGAISKHANGRTMLSNILERMEHYPTYLRWHCSAFLLQQGAAELSKLAISVSAF